MAELFSWSALALLGVLTVFQLALALGAPLGHLAWGGRHRTLPKPLRSASLATAVFLVVGIAAVLRAGGLGMDAVPLAAARAFVWALTAVMVFSIIGNAATASAPERAFGLPMSIAITASLLGVLLWP